MSGMFVIESNSDSARLACCMVAFVFVFVIMIMAICWTNRENFENFNDSMKYNNETIKNVLGGGFHYKALSPKDDILKKFQELDKSKKIAIVAVMAPWCGYCKRLKSSGVLRKIANKYPVLTMDDQHPQTRDVMNAMEGEGFPSIGIYVNGKLLPYKGSREYEAIDNFMKSFSKQPKMEENNTTTPMVIPQQMSKNEYNKILKTKKHVCTLFMAPWCGHCKRLKASGTLEKLANSGITVLVADDKTNLSKEMKIEGFPTIYCMANGKNMKYQGDRSYESIIQFLGK